MVLILHPQFGALAHLVERNTGSVEVSGSSPLCSTSRTQTTDNQLPAFSFSPTLAFTLTIEQIFVI